MPLTDTDICNLALAELGISEEITALTDDGNEARQCNRVYDKAVEFVLTECEWPFTTKIASLGLIQENPNDNWGYEYRYPSDCVLARRIASGDPRPQSEPPFQLADDASGLVIWTNEPSACLEYNERVTTTTRWPLLFSEALSLKVAEMVAMPLTGDINIKRDLFQLYTQKLSAAKARALNEGHLPPEPDTPSIAAR